MTIQNIYRVSIIGIMLVGCNSPVVGSWRATEVCIDNDEVGVSDFCNDYPLATNSETGSTNAITLLINDDHTGTFSILEIDTQGNVIASDGWMFTMQKYENEEYKLTLEFPEDMVGYLNCTLEQRIFACTSESPDDAWGAGNVFRYTFEPMDGN